MAAFRATVRASGMLARGHAGGPEWVRAMSSAAAAASKSVADPSTLSPVKQMFFGRLAGKQMFPFPCALTEEQKESIDAMAEPVGKFFDEKIDSAQIDWDHKIPDEVMQGLRDMGLFGLQIDPEFNGLGLSNTEYARIVEELVMDPAIAVTLMAHQSIGLKGILLCGTQAQKEEYLPRLATGEHIAAFALTEPSAGSDAAGIKTKAVLADDGSGDWVMNGSKMWISNGGWADVFTVFARTPSPDGGEDKMTAFIVEKAFGGITPGKPEEKLGIRASNTVTLAFDNVRIPAKNVLGEAGSGFKVAMQILNNGRFGLGAGTGSGTRKLATMILEHCTSRTQFGRPLAEFGLVQADLAHMAECAYAAEAMAYTTTALIDGGCPDASLEAAACKVFGSEIMWDAVNRCISLMGGLGFADGPGAPPYARMMRDSRILSIFEGENRVLRLLIALQGVRSPGAQLAKFAKAPLSDLGMLRSVAADQVHKLGMVDMAAAVAGSGEEASVATAFAAAPGLGTSAAELATLVSAHGSSVRLALAKHGRDIMEQQLLLQRLADNTIDLFASAAVVSRASTAHANGAASASHEAKIARSFSRKAAARVRTRLHELRTAQAADKETLGIARDMIDNGGYVPAHPLKL